MLPLFQEGIQEGSLEAKAGPGANFSRDAR